MATLAAVRVQSVLSEEWPPRTDGDAKDLGTDEELRSAQGHSEQRAGKGTAGAEGRGAASGSMPADGSRLVKAPR
jgi:hypothetical protein